MVTNLFSRSPVASSLISSKILLVYTEHFPKENIFLQLCLSFRTTHFLKSSIGERGCFGVMRMLNLLLKTHSFVLFINSSHWPNMRK
jgi:hypothetical protein